MFGLFNCVASDRSKEIVSSSNKDRRFAKSTSRFQLAMFVCLAKDEPWICYAQS